MLENNGLEKNDILNIYFNDTIGKREFIYEFLISTLLPKEWCGMNCDEAPIIIEEGQELGAILIDIQGSFSCYKFLEKIRHYYDSK